MKIKYLLKGFFFVLSMLFIACNEENEENAGNTMATLDYLILELGGSGIFKDVKPNPTYWGADIEILRSYLENNLGGTIDAEYSEPQGRIIYTSK